MSVKNFIKEREEKQRLLLELKNIILKEDSRGLKIFKKLNIKDFDEVLKLFVNIGNTSYVSGDNYIFEYFVESLFEMINADPEELDKEEIIKYIHNYGIMSAQNYDIISYSTIVEGFKENIVMQEETKVINYHLKILRELASKAVALNFELGVLEVLNALRDIHGRFVDDDKQVNGLYLMNTIISLIYSAERSRNLDLKEKIIFETNGVLKLTLPRIGPEAVEVGSTQEPEEGVLPKQAA